MKVIFLPTHEKQVLALQTYEGFSFPGADISNALNSTILSAAREVFRFISEEEMTKCTFTRLGPQGFFFNKSQKYVGIQVVLTDDANIAFEKLMSKYDLAFAWENSSSIIQPMLQAIIDPALYEACSSDIDVYALDRIANSGGMTAQQVAEEFGISLNQATTGLFALAKKGFVQCWERAGRVFKITELGLSELDQVGWTPTNNSNNDEVFQANYVPLAVNIADVKVVPPEAAPAEVMPPESVYPKLSVNQLRILYLRCTSHNRERIEALGFSNYEYRAASGLYAQLKKISPTLLSKVLKPGTSEAKELYEFINSHPKSTYIKLGHWNED